jgi:hypothetical protein
MAVTSSDGVQVGRVVDVTMDALIIEKGRFFLQELRIPFGDIATCLGDDIVLKRDHATLRRMDEKASASMAKKTVGVAGIAAPPPQEGLGLGPTDLTQARMDSAKFQDHERYDLRPTGETVAPLHPPPHEPAMTERRAAGPGWDPLSVDEEPTEAPRGIGPDDTEPPTRY